MAPLVRSEGHRKTHIYATWYGLPLCYPRRIVTFPFWRFPLGCLIVPPAPPCASPPIHRLVPKICRPSNIYSYPRRELLVRV